MREIRRRMKTRNEAAGILVTNAAKGLCGVDTGRLRASIAYSADEEGATIGTNVEYGPNHHFGNRNTPPNPFLVNGVVNSTAGLKRVYGAGG